MKKINPVLQAHRHQSRSHGWKYFKDNYLNLVYMIPVIIGILGFTIFPMVTALIYSFRSMDLMSPTAELGPFTWDFYKQAFTGDGLKVNLKAYWITIRHSVVVGGISFVGSYILALALNQKIKGMATFRILYYLPCLIPGLASSLLWQGLTKQTGYFNLILLNLGLEPYTFYSSNSTIFPTMIMLSGWGFSGNMIMWLAQFKNIPKELYEEAELSGAGYFKQLFHITIPMSTSMIFYLLVMNIISNLQALNGYTMYIDTGRIYDELYFLGTHIYETAYVHHNISYACALSWILFGVIGLLTIAVFKSGSSWVYYSEEN